jgi:hypothetical protein
MEIAHFGNIEVYITSVRFKFWLGFSELCPMITFVSVLIDLFS